jgi:hypothetical protein
MEKNVFEKTVDRRKVLGGMFATAAGLAIPLSMQRTAGADTKASNVSSMGPNQWEASSIKVMSPVIAPDGITAKCMGGVCINKTSASVTVHCNYPAPARNITIAVTPSTIVGGKASVTTGELAAIEIGDTLFLRTDVDGNGLRTALFITVNETAYWATVQSLDSSFLYCTILDRGTGWTGSSGAPLQVGITKDTTFRPVMPDVGSKIYVYGMQNLVDNSFWALTVLTTVDSIPASPAGLKVMSGPSR